MISRRAKRMSGICAVALTAAQIKRTARIKNMAGKLKVTKIVIRVRA
jgi:hypothetical protein